MPLFRHFILCAAAFAAPATAQTFEDLPALDARISAALGAGIGEPGGAARPLDSRLRLASCPEPTSIEPPALGAVTVRCEPLGWRIRVPIVRLAAAAGTFAEAAKPLVKRGDQVELRAGGGAFAVSTLAIAEEDGAAGARIRVRPDRQSPAIIAEVEASGRVVLPGFK